MIALTVPPYFFLHFSSNPPGLRCPVFAARVVARLQKADRCPCSASAVSAAGSASAAQPAARRCSPAAAPPPPYGGSKPITAPSAAAPGGLLFCRKLLCFCFNRIPPGCRYPNMRRGAEPACIFGRLPLLRLAASAAGSARLRSPPPIAVPPALRARPGGARCRWLLLLFIGNTSPKDLRSANPGGAVFGLEPPTGGAAAGRRGTAMGGGWV